MDDLLKWLDEERGRRVLLAAELDIDPSAISQWKSIPPGRVLAIERHTCISRHKLRPDLYGPMPEAAE
ncbi:YdaS family helix-turn-helix protein [Neorhizobium sp. R1-B]|uniref:transcriptional regulator n=1 Tax=Neorhizobium sp. R1-B TaxID=2485162 RepID=UPI001065D0E0|nr:YdaS family helix-turn-helix protein [Neorhizobium sp. R1-B]